METQLIAPVIGVLVSAAITPGPNNFIVMEAGGRGILAAGKVIIGVVAGSLCLLAFVAAGVGQLAAGGTWPAKLTLVAGSLYLAWLGIGLFVRAGKSDEGQSTRGVPSSVLGVTAFQLMNPKAWMLVASVAAASVADSYLLNLIVVGALIAAVSIVCLTLWAVAGAAFAGLLARPRVRKWFDRAMGVLLASSAIGLALGAMPTR